MNFLQFLLLCTLLVLTFVTALDEHEADVGHESDEAVEVNDGDEEDEDNEEEGLEEELEEEVVEEDDLAALLRRAEESIDDFPVASLVNVATKLCLSSEEDDAVLGDMKQLGECTDSPFAKWSFFAAGGNMAYLHIQDNHLTRRFTKCKARKLKKAKNKCGKDSRPFRNNGCIAQSFHDKDAIILARTKCFDWRLERSENIGNGMRLLQLSTNRVTGGCLAQLPTGELTLKPCVENDNSQLFLWRTENLDGASVSLPSFYGVPATASATVTATAAANTMTTFQIAQLLLLSCLLIAVCILICGQYKITKQTPSPPDAQIAGKSLFI